MQLLELMDAMVLIIDRLENLEQECPEVKDSATYKWMIQSKNLLTDLIIADTKAINEMTDAVKKQAGETDFSEKIKPEDLN